MQPAAQVQISPVMLVLSMAIKIPAEVAGLSKRAFIEIMGKYGFSVFSESIEGFRHDLEVVRLFKPSAPKSG
jgi:hypothetical protein